MNPVIGELLHRLAAGWPAAHGEAASELLAQWRTGLHCELEAQPGVDNALAFTADLSAIRLHGTHDMPGLLLGGSLEQARPILREFWNHASGAGRLPLVLAVSPAAAAAVSEIIPRGDAVVIGVGAIEELFKAAKPLEFLKQQMRAQVPRQRLIPYNITTPALGGMFFGRRYELDRLLYETDVSFAVAGPGRIGKTSLLRQYKRELRRRRDSRRHRLHEIDCFNCETMTEDEIARHLAMNIAPTSQADKVNRHGLLRFLRLQSHAADGRLELLVDEVDSVCLGESFQILGDAVKSGLCRAVLCGKGALLKMMLTTEKALSGRLDLIRPEPLESEAATALILEPLTDLGFKAPSPPLLIERLFKLTGRQPQLLQSCVRRLIEYALQEQTDLIAEKHLARLERDLTTFFDAMCPLRDMADNLTRLAALLLLQRRAHEVTLGMMEALLRGVGLPVDYQQAMDVCGDLVINNVLAWERGGYHLANATLPELAHRMGFLDSAIARLLAELKADGRLRPAYAQPGAAVV